MDVFVSQLFNGLSIGSVLLLIALGLTFTFGQMGVINMAHGELIMIGAYTAYMVGESVGTVSLVVALPIAFVIAGLLGVVMERLLISRLYGRPLDTLLVTWGVSLILQQVARDIFGAPNVNVTKPSWLDGSFQVFGTTLPFTRLFIIGLVGSAVVVIWIYSTRMTTGVRMRAVTQNRQLAAVSGINVQRVDQRTFFIGSGLAGAAGVALTLLGPIGPTLGTNYIVDAFLVVVAGGLGQIRGAVIAAIGLGIMSSFVEYRTSTSIAKVAVFVAVVILLQFRPQGIVALRTRALT
ncbi:MAG: urea ABC transporter permease subunit UrtB [Acidimicrobiales bacterium]